MRVRQLRPAGALAGVLLAACATAANRPEARDSVRGPTPTRAAGAASPGYLGWAHSKELRLVGRRASISGRVGAECVSHVGCAALPMALPRCTPAGELPPGLRYLRGTLEENTPDEDMLVMEWPGFCRENAYRGVMRFRTASGVYRLDEGLACAGDRSGMCCPILSGTIASVVARMATDRENALAEYWLCAEPPERVDGCRSAPAPIAIDVDPGLVPGSSFIGAPDASPLAFWFGSRVAFWDVQTDALGGFMTSGGALSCVTRSPKGSTVFGIDVEGTGVLWDGATGRKLARFAKLAPPAFFGRVEPDSTCTNFLVQAVHFSDDGESLLLVTASGRALLWRRSLGSTIELPTTGVVAGSYAFSPDGAAVVISAENDFNLWSVRGDRFVGNAPGHVVGFVRNGHALAFCGNAKSDGTWGECRLWDLRTWQMAEKPLGCGLEMSPSGSFVSVQSVCYGTAHRDTHVLRTADAKEVAVVRDGYDSAWNTGDRLTVQSEGGIQLWKSGSAPKLLVRGKLAGETGLLFSPDGASAATPFRIVRVPTGREVRLQGAEREASGGWSADGQLLGTWTVVDQTIYEATSSLTVSVFDAGSGCPLLKMAEKAPRSQRQALVGTASPRWLPGTDVLELPVLGDDRFVRLVRPRTQEILWATMVEAQAGSYAPYVFAADGRYDGADAAVAENLGREGAPKITAPMRRAVGLVRLFLSERPAANPGKCRGERLHELRQQPMNAPGK